MTGILFVLSSNRRFAACKAQTPDLGSLRSPRRGHILMKQIITSRPRPRGRSDREPGPMLRKCSGRHQCAAQEGCCAITGIPIAECPHTFVSRNSPNPFTRANSACASGVPIGSLPWKQPRRLNAWHGPRVCAPSGRLPGESGKGREARWRVPDFATRGFRFYKI